MATPPLKLEYNGAGVTGTVLQADRDIDNADKHNRDKEYVNIFSFIENSGIMHLTEQSG